MALNRMFCFLLAFLGVIIVIVYVCLVVMVAIVFFRIWFYLIIWYTFYARVHAIGILYM